MLSPTMRNQGLFIWRSCQNIDGVNGKRLKMCPSIVESRRGVNNVHFVSMNRFCLYIGSLGFWVKLRFVIWYEVLAFLQEWSNCVSTRVCTRLWTLQQRVQKDEANMGKKTTHIPKMFPKLWSFLHNHRKLHLDLLWPWFYKANLNLASELQVAMNETCMIVEHVQSLLSSMLLLHDNPLSTVLLHDDAPLAQW
jgi:hypothetical protein